MGPDVLAVQEALKIRTLGLTLQTDGKFGPKTELVVKDFQHQNCLKLDGIVDLKTRSVLYPLVATTLNLVRTRMRDVSSFPMPANIFPRLGALKIPIKLFLETKT